MARAAKACGKPRCPNPQPCPDHSKVAWSGSTRRSRLPSDWERRRRTVLARDQICRICTDALSTEVDHITAGDNHDLDNLQGVCTQCHRRKTAAEAAQARSH